jgi:hypothetical protein
VTRALVGILVLALCGPAQAHKPSDSYLHLGAPIAAGDRARLPLRWDVALRDLDRALGIDTDHDGAITWGEVRAADRAARALLMAHFGASVAGSACTIVDRTGAAPKIARHSDGTYAVYSFELDCPVVKESIEVDYSLLFDLDPQHRGLLRAPGGAGEQVVVLSRQQRSVKLSLPEARSPARHLFAAIGEGIHHIWTGYDHLLFLLALLLPAVLRREGRQWLPVDRLKVALIDVLKVVTAFTAAHSVTLSLAALGVLSLPSRLVESAIAASVVLAALNNLWPLVRADRWLAAFALGLLHGFGFSSTLADLGLSAATLLPTLVGFNLGVEIGQACVVAIFVPIAYLLRRRGVYRWGLLQAGSVLIAIVAALWLCERAFDVVIISR